MLTIGSGSLKGRRLITPKTGPARPTLSKTRDAIFNILQSRYDLSQYKAVDLFAGTGALGFEAISRGASSVDFVEKDHQLFKLLKKNHQQLDPQKPCGFFQQDAVSWLKKRTFQKGPWLFLLDPPYESSLLEKTLEVLNNQVKSLHQALIVIETPKDNSLTLNDQFYIFKQRSFGATRLDFIEIL